MNISIASVALCPDVRQADTGHAIVLLDVSSNRTETLIDGGRVFWIHLAVSGDVAAAAEAAGLSSDTAGNLTSYLIGRGVLEESPAPMGWEQPASVPQRLSWGVRESSVQLVPLPPVPWGWKLLAVPALAVTLTVRQLCHREHRFARLVSLLRLGTKVTGRRADLASAQNAVRAVRWVGRFTPARVACLEESVSSFLLLAFLGREVTWIQGMASDPVQMHAWVEVDGRPVEEPAWAEEYIPMLRVPETPTK
jgi:hypothetical protein